MTGNEKQLSKLYELSLMLSGEPMEIIWKIAAMIAEFYNVRVVVLTEIKDKELYFLCAHIDGELKTDLGHVPLEFTPCALVKEGKQGQFFDQVSEIFPQVDFLKQQKAFFYYGAPAMDNAGNVISTTCLLDEKHHDLTEQNQELLRIFGQRIAMELERKSTLEKQVTTEKALQLSQSELYSLTNISPVGIFRTDFNGQCFYVNEQWSQFSGMTVDQASGQGWLTAVHPKDRQLLTDGWDKSLGKDDDFELEHRYLSPQNKITWVVARVTAEKNSDGDITGYIGIVTDITDRKKQEIENENIRLKLTEAQNISHLGFFEYNFESDDDYWSDEVYLILGTDPQQTQAGFDSLISFVHPDDASLVEEAIEQLRQGGIYNIDYRIVEPDGGEKILHGEAKLHVDENNQPQKIVGTVQDISERKYVENALNALSEYFSVDDMSNFYKSAVYNLARIYNAQYAFLGLIDQSNTNRVKVQAIWTGTDFGENFEYDLCGTPCADVINYHMSMVPKDAAKLYPDDKLLTDMNIEGYYGVPLITPSGIKVGMIAIMDTEPMLVGHWTKSLLGIFSQQLASHIEHFRDEREVKESQKKLSSILENMQDIYIRTDIEGKLTMMSPAGTALLGYTTADILGNFLSDLYLRMEDHNKLKEMLKDNEGQVHNFTAALRHKDGHTVWASTNAQYVYDDEGNKLGIEAFLRDISHQYLNDLQMKKMSGALEQTADMVMISDKEGVIEYVNPMFERTTGYRNDELIGNKPSILKSGHQSDAFYKNLWDTILDGKVFSNVFINKKRDGSIFYQDEIITPLKNKLGEITHFIATGRDISQRMENEKRLKFVAHHDGLTGLPNRVLFMDRIQQSLVQAKRGSHRVAILFLDLDRFKNINDTLGHTLGDKLLIEIASRLEKSLREGDSIARLGGDEFAVLVNKISSEKDVIKIAQKILNCIEKTVVIKGHSLYTTASIGVSLYPDDGENGDTLLKNADIAMYRAKDMGKNNFQFYSEDMSTRTVQRLAMENSLREALNRNEFVLYYQPQVDTFTQEIVGIEALIRWQHPDLGLVPPAEFISLLEETGLIIDVGDWVLETACQQLLAWSQSGFSNLGMSINVSSRQFHRQTFYDRIVDLSQKYGISANLIELEITESILMSQQELTTRNINKLNDYGFKIAIDDFGTGYSSLSYLQNFKVNTLKIDRSFIKDIETNADDASITLAIIAMAHSLKLNIVAEGVETIQQLEFLKQHECQQIQGYLFSQPLTAKNMTQLLHNGLPRIMV